MDASTRNFGMIAPSITAAGGEWAGYAQATTEIYRGLQEQRDLSVQVTGSLYLASTALEDAVLREYAALPARRACVYLDAAEAVARFPLVHRAYCAGALLFPHDLGVDPRRMLHAMIPFAVETAPLDYLPHTAIAAVEPAGSKCKVTAAGGEVMLAGRVIVCSGAEYRTLFPDLLRRSGLRVCKLQMMQTEAVAGFSLPHAVLSRLSIRRYPGFAGCPSYDVLQAQPQDEEIHAYGIHLLFKQAPDGSVIVGDSHEYSDFAGAPLLEERTNPRITAAILRHGQEMLALPSWTIRDQWNGYYLVHPDLPIYTETIDGLIHVVTGIGGKGMTTGPGFARSHVDAILG
jgi:FAD dependent oxidoreductase TIGR03364